MTLKRASWVGDKLLIYDGRQQIALDREAALGLLKALLTPQAFAAGSITYIGAGGDTPAYVFFEGRTMHVALIKGGRIDHVKVVLDGTIGESMQIDAAIPLPREAK